MASYPEIFNLIRSLDQGERRNLSVFIKSRRQESFSLKLLEALYVMPALDLKLLRKKLRASDDKIQRGLHKLFGFVLDTRSRYDQSIREKVVAAIADVEYLLKKKAWKLGRNHLEKTIAIAEKHEFFDLHIQLLETLCAISQDRERVKAQIQLVKAAQQEVETINSLHDHLDQARALVDTDHGQLLVRSILGELPKENDLMSIRAKIIMHKVAWRGYIFVHEHGKAKYHLKKRLTLLRSYMHIVRNALREELMQRFVLTRVHLQLEELDRAKAQLQEIQGMDLDSVELLAERFQHYCLTQLAFACDYADVSVGNAAVSLFREHLDEYEPLIDENRCRLLLYVALKFLFYSQQWELIQKLLPRVSKAPKDRVKTDVQEYVEVIRLLTLYESEERKALRYRLSRLLEAGPPKTTTLLLVIELVSDLMGKERDPAETVNQFRSRIGEIPSEESYFFDFELYLRSQESGRSMLSLRNATLNEERRKQS